MASDDCSLCRFLSCFWCKKRHQRGDSGGRSGNTEQQQLGGGTINDPCTTSSTGGTSGNNPQLQQIGGSETIDPHSSTSSLASQEAALEYEVFLSFRGADIRNTFTNHLYYALKDAGFCTFMDNEELRVGEEIGPKLMRSIKQSKIGIPIFSADYASSKWCLMEVAEMVKSMKEGKMLIMPIFYNVSVDDIQHQTGSYTDSFAHHEKRFGQEKVQSWRDALREVVKLKGLELAKVANGEEGAFIKLVVARIIIELKKPYLEMGEVLVGIEDRAEKLVNKLQIGVDDVRFIGIWGMGGIGKTTLAKYVYNQVMNKFECHSFLKNIRETARTPKGLQSLQSKLVADILRRGKEDYSDVEAGVSVLKERLCNKKAIVLLDDVDHIDQLKALAADAGWFGRGSRIIITTREKKVLDLSHVKDLYPVELLDNDQAFELFCRHAFGDKSPRLDLVEQAREIVNITGGLPLSLEVTGSFLSIYVGKGVMWRDMIEKLKRKPDMDVQDKLMVSYESLECQQKEIFLDIACFFIGMDVRLVTPMWNDAELFPELGIEILQLKSLIKIGDDHTIWMHDQLRDLGRSIVDGIDNEPGRRSRIWRSEDAFSVLVRGQGTDKVNAIRLEGYHFTKKNDHLRDTMFSKMPNLRILDLGSARLDGNFQHLFDQLRWLSWHRESISLPKNLDLKNLIVLDLSGSLIKQRWIARISVKIGLKLKVLNLSNSAIRKTPNFSAFPSLEILILEECERLIHIHPSMGLLKNLILLNLRKCSELKKLPEQLGSMESLTELLIDETSAAEIPISEGMKKLEVLSASGCCSLREVPKSIGSLTNLKRISFGSCVQLHELPDSIGKLTSLVELDLSYSSIKSLPNFQGDVHYCLEKLVLEGTDIDGLPGSLSCLKKLKELNVSWPRGEECREIPDDALNLSSLRELTLSNVKRLPESLSALSCLQTFDLSYCRNLQSLPELPPCLVRLEVTEVSSKQPGGFPNLESLVNLKKLILDDGDFELKEGCLSHMRKLEILSLSRLNIRSLPEDISSFPCLKEVFIHACKELHHVPKLPPCLSTFSFTHCGSFKKLPDLSNLKQLSLIQVTCPDIPKEIPGLEYLTFRTSNYCDGIPLLTVVGQNISI